MARFSYGGQALIEGVMMRGRDAIAVALRHPDGRILWADERLVVGFRGTRWARLPFMRGLVVLYETLVVGTRWLVRSASVAAAAEERADAADQAAAPGPDGPAMVSQAAEMDLAVDCADAAVADTPVATEVRARPADPAASDAAPSDAAPSTSERDAARASTPAVDSVDLGKGAVALMLGLTLIVGVGLFFFLPLAIAKLVAGGQPALVERAVEAIVQVTIFVGYLTLIGRTPDVRRTFQYHGAEHMTIHAFEAGDPLTVNEVRKYPTAHPRCGTEFLVVVILVSIIVFSLVGRLDLPLMVASRLILIPVIAGISYELLRFGARHRSSRLVRWVFQPGIWVQKITTKQPSDDMIEVAIVSLEQALLADGEAVPAGGGAFTRSRLVLGGSAAPSDPVPGA